MYWFFCWFCCLSRIRWNGIAHPLERYRASAGTVSRILIGIR
jgi:hypothetical protein